MVALLAEGVDRNKKNLIEKELLDVALLAEGVDRNLQAGQVNSNRASRPPRGGRG